MDLGIIGIALALLGKVVVDHFKIEKLERDLNGVGARARNAEWERYKMQLVDLAEDASKESRRWKVEQYLKR